MQHRAAKLPITAYTGERWPADNLKMRQYHQGAHCAGFLADDAAEPSIDYPFCHMLGGKGNDRCLSPSTAFQTIPAQLDDQYVECCNENQEEAKPLLTPPNSDPPQTMQRHCLPSPFAMSPLQALNTENPTVCPSLLSRHAFSSPIGGINPALLVLSSPTSIPGSLAFTPLPQDGPTETAAFESRSRTPQGVTVGTTSLKAVDTTKASDLTVTGSAVYRKHRNGTCRCLSGNCGMRPRAWSGLTRVVGEHELCNAAPAYNQSRAAGRLPLLEVQHHLQCLNRIMERETLRSTGSAIKFTIDPTGRARVDIITKRGDAATSISRILQRRRQRSESGLMKCRNTRRPYHRVSQDTEGFQYYINRP
ncbi:hypothetical protein V3481_019128 [Fusarium oxysporum f. sp. vasinfectum]